MDIVNVYTHETLGNTQCFIAEENETVHTHTHIQGREGGSVRGREGGSVREEGV